MRCVPSPPALCWPGRQRQRSCLRCIGVHFMTGRKMRSAMPLPRYVERRWLRREQEWSYLFNVPSWAKKPAADDPRGACSLESEALGTDYAAAVKRAETILLPQFDAWRTGGLAGDVTKGPARGSFDWMVSLYRGSPQYTKLSGRQKGNYEYGLRIASAHALKKNPKGLTRFGELRLT